MFYDPADDTETIYIPLFLTNIKIYCSVKLAYVVYHFDTLLFSELGNKGTYSVIHECRALWRVSFISLIQTCSETLSRELAY